MSSASGSSSSIDYNSIKSYKFPSITMPSHLDPDVIDVDESFYDFCDIPSPVPGANTPHNNCLTGAAADDSSPTFAPQEYAVDNGILVNSPPAPEDDIGSFVDDNEFNNTHGVTQSTDNRTIDLTGPSVEEFVFNCVQKDLKAVLILEQISSILNQNKDTLEEIKLKRTQQIEQRQMAESSFDDANNDNDNDDNDDDDDDDDDDDNNNNNNNNINAHTTFNEPFCDETNDIDDLQTYNFAIKNWIHLDGNCLEFLLDSNIRKSIDLELLSRITQLKSKEDSLSIKITLLKILIFQALYETVELDEVYSYSFAENFQISSFSNMTKIDLMNNVELTKSFIKVNIPELVCPSLSI